MADVTSDWQGCTVYAVMGRLFTADPKRATGATRLLRGAQVFVNEWYAGCRATPIGGNGKSGHGREKGREVLWNCVQPRTSPSG